MIVYEKENIIEFHPENVYLLKDYNMETVTDLEELNGEINGSK